VTRLALAALALLLIATPVAADDVREAWAALITGGHVALVRHGNAPPGYGGDPPGFKIDDCATQRNMDDRGRSQAKAVGEGFRQHGVRADRILSSPWCRCLETAQLMGLGAVESEWIVAASADKSPERLIALRQMVSEWRGPGTLVVVTHALTVQGLVGILPGQAETVVQTQVGQGAGSRRGGQDPRAGVTVGLARLP
jgi:phosphohistidine phosphatase SixA